MKIAKLLILPLVLVGLMLTNNNFNNRVEAMGNKQACIDECVRIHTDAAKACCAVAPYNPIAFAGCMLLAGGSLTACLGLCGAILGGS